MPLECWGVHAMAESSFFTTLNRELIALRPADESWIATCRLEHIEC